MIEHISPEDETEVKQQFVNISRTYPHLKIIPETLDGYIAPTEEPDETGYYNVTKALQLIGYLNSAISDVKKGGNMYSSFKWWRTVAKGYWEDTLLGKEGGPHVIKDAVRIITGIYGRGWGMKPKVEQK